MVPTFPVGALFISVVVTLSYVSNARHLGPDLIPSRGIHLELEFGYVLSPHLRR